MSRSLTVNWEDPIAAFAAGKALAGLDYMKEMIAGRIAPPPIAVLLGFTLTQVEPGQVVFECTPGERHYNPIGVVHGGLAMTLLDSAMGCCVQSRTPAGGGYTTLEAKTNLVRPITAETGPLRAVGKVVHAGKRVATAEARLQDPSGKLYAHATSTCIVL